MKLSSGYMVMEKLHQRRNIERELISSNLLESQSDKDTSIIVNWMSILDNLRILNQLLNLELQSLNI